MSVHSHDSLGFRESTHLIPTPGLERRRPPRYEPFILKVWVVVPIALTLVGTAIALEATLAVSNRNNGFYVPLQKTGLFKFASTQFLTSFFPTLLLGPLALLWLEADWLLKWYHPYVVLSKGNALAEESLLLDYIALGNFFAFFAAIKHKHALVLLSTITALEAYLLQPLAGSVLQIRPVTDTQYATVTSIRSIGLDPDFAFLDAFAASAGFVQAAVYNSLPDPPFVEGGWTAAEFVFPTNPVVNGSIAVNTTGIQTTPNCNSPSSLQLSTPTAEDFSITVSLPGGCEQTVLFDPTTADRQYGVVNVPNCGPATNVTFQPVLFWFFHVAGDGTPGARSVFCTPTLATFNILATANLNNGSLANATIYDGYTTPNNVTGPPLSGQAFNAVVFDNSTDPFVQARATAIKSGVPGAIFRLATQQPNGLDSVFSDPNGFLALTEDVYRQHLSLSAKSVYFLPENATLPAKMSSLRPKLFVEALPAHGLASILFTIGLVGLVVHIIHRHARRNLWLTTPPGSIAAIVSLTARSGFGDLLLPYDDTRTMGRKMRGLKFGLDRRTGAIVADDDGTGPIKLGPNDAMMTLLGQDNQRTSDPTTPPWHSAKSQSFDVFNPYDPPDL